MSYTNEDIPDYARNVPTNNVKKYINLIEGKACPKCLEDQQFDEKHHVGYLTLKTGRYGEFMGCSEFPKCHYALKVTALPHNTIPSFDDR